MANRLPKYYIVQCKALDERWFKYIADLNTKYGSSFEGSYKGCWYGYDGNVNSYNSVVHGVGHYRDANSFINNPTQLTLDEYEELSKDIESMSKHYAIQCTDPNDLRWLRYIDYINKLATRYKYKGKTVGTWYGFDKSDYNGGVICRYEFARFTLGTVSLTLDDFNRLVPEEFVVPERWCFKGCAQFQDWSETNAPQYKGYISNWYHWHASDCWNTTRHIPHGYVEITFDQYLKYIYKQVVPAFDKNNWMVAVDTADKRKDVAEWIDAQGSDAIKLVGHSYCYDNLYYGWKQGKFWATSSYKPDPELFITWEQFQTLQSPSETDTVDTTPTQQINREGLKVIYDNVCNDWKLYIMQILKQDQFAFDFELPTADIIRGYKQANSEQKVILDKYFLIDKDESVLVAGITKDAVREASKMLFGNGNIMDLLTIRTPSDRPELNEQALYIADAYKVEMGEAVHGGTWINIQKK